MASTIIGSRPLSTEAIKQFVKDMESPCPPLLIHKELSFALIDHNLPETGRKALTEGVRRWWLTGLDLWYEKRKLPLSLSGKSNLGLGEMRVLAMQDPGSHGTWKTWEVSHGMAMLRKHIKTCSVEDLRDIVLNHISVADGLCASCNDLYYSRVPLIPSVHYCNKVSGVPMGTMRMWFDTHNPNVYSRIMTYHNEHGDWSSDFLPLLGICCKTNCKVYCGSCEKALSTSFIPEEFESYKQLGACLECLKHSIIGLKPPDLNHRHLRRILRERGGRRFGRNLQAPPTGF